MSLKRTVVHCFALVTISLFLPTLVPGASAQGQARENIQLYIWYDGDRALLRPIHNLLWLYQQQYPQTRIHLNIRSTAQAYEDLRGWAGPQADYAPDMAIVPSSWLPQFAPAFRSLQQALTPQQRQAFYQPVLDVFTHDGRLRAIPWSVGGRGLLVRADLLREAELSAPATWTQVLDVAAKLHNPPAVYGLGLLGSYEAAHLVIGILGAEGGSLYDDQETLRLDTELVTEALEFYGQLVSVAQPQVLTWTQAELEELFVQGKLAMLVTDSAWMQEVAGDEDLGLEVQAVALPAQEQPVADLRGEGLVIFKKSAHMKSCLEFVRMICEERCQEQLIKLGGLPTGPALANIYRQDPIRGPLSTHLDQARNIPGRDVGAVEEALSLAVYLSLSGRGTPLEALQQAQSMLLTTD